VQGVAGFTGSILIVPCASRYEADCVRITILPRWPVMEPLQARSGLMERQLGFDKTLQLSGSEECGRFRPLCSVLLDDDESLLHARSLLSRS